MYIYKSVKPNTSHNKTKYNTNLIVFIGKTYKIIMVTKKYCN